MGEQDAHSSTLFEHRMAGVLLHPTALADQHGILGRNARQFIDFIAQSGLSVWQTLPVGPTHSDLSPYQSLSAHAGNPWFIDLSELVPLELLSEQELVKMSDGGRGRLLRLAATRFFRGEGLLHRESYDRFCQEQSRWLEDFALFCAIREHQEGLSWPDWPRALRDRAPDAISAFEQDHQTIVREIRFEQFLFHHQWQALKSYANARGVRLFGDIPIFVAYDSADVWANRHLFKLDESGAPTVVAGVPPDYFSPDGQHWGNPLYNWDAMAADGFAWWLERLDSQRHLFDLIRIDHFRGLEAYWEIPAATPEPRFGYWVPGPGRAFLETCFQRFPDLPLIAENLGIISDEVEQLRHAFQLPGMAVIQFAFDGNSDNPHLLHRHEQRGIVYTGTHDNDTTLGWYQSLDESTRGYVNSYLSTDGHDMPWPMIEAACRSASWLAMIPMQDFLGLDSSARFNTPGTTSGNWLWRLDLSLCTTELVCRIRQLLERNERSLSGVVII